MCQPNYFGVHTSFKRPPYSIQQIFQVLFSNSPNPQRYENGKKSLNFAQQASHNTWMWSEQPVDQREHKRINQNDQRWPLKLTIIPLSCVLFLLFIIITDKKPKHSEKIHSVLGERPNISLALCSEFQRRVKKTK